MITDAQTRLINATAVTSSAVTSDTYDTGSTNTPKRNIGRGRGLRLIVTADVTFAGGTNLVLTYVQSANSNLSSADILATSATLTAITAGDTLWDIPLPDNTKRYLGVVATPSGTWTAGKISANIVSDTANQPYYKAETGL